PMLSFFSTNGRNPRPSPYAEYSASSSPHVTVWSYSNAPFAIALPTQRTEAILEGMTQAFEFFDRVPKEVWWDNPRTVADAVLSGRERKINARYAALASHFAFEPLFCLPAKGNEKPVVENRVKTLERKWSTPVPQMQDMAELNEYLRKCCVRERDRNSSGKTETIGIRFERDKPERLPNSANSRPRHPDGQTLTRWVRFQRRSGSVLNAYLLPLLPTSFRQSVLSISFVTDGRTSLITFSNSCTER
ncbi:MAG: transposase family protein, partial [Planctomycetes bacterium]|nr:transposase family protein [Planctomycetota bacterium]